MGYRIFYSCATDKGNCRKINQDNFICDGTYMEDAGDERLLPLRGCIESKRGGVVGVFDGLGGEACGEVAALIAAQEASKIPRQPKNRDSLLDFCEKANQKICQYAERNAVSSMGTTAAMLMFCKEGISLCNIGDSKIFRFSQNRLRQISVDHLESAAYGLKPSLSQCSCAVK